MRRRREGSVQSACLQWLQIHRILAWRNNTGAARLPGKGGKMRPVFFGVAGAPDILGVLPGGRALAIECKRPLGPRGGHGGSVQTDDQIEFQREFERAGGLYIVARGLDDLEFLEGENDP